MNRNLLLTFIVLLISSCALIASPPKNLKYLKSKPANFKPCRLMAPEAIKASQSKGAIRRAGESGVISSTTTKIIVIRVQFSDATVATTNTTLKSATEGFFAKFRDYYFENSYGLLTASATVTSNIYTLSSVSNYNNETDAALQKLISDTLSTSVTTDYNLSQYNHIMIYHAGRGEEESGNPNDLWSLFYPFSFIVSSKTFTGFTIVPEKSSGNSSPLGVICHEYGHQLGLPDIYDTSSSGGSSTCGSWSLMDYPYGYDNTGQNPPHLDPWCKNFLRFVDFSSRLENTSAAGLTLGDIETSQTTGFYKIPVFNGSSEYFVVELRQKNPLKSKYDLSIPGEGVLVWHIDDSIALDSSRLANNTVNTGSPNLGVDLVEADATANYPPGEPGDAFTNGALFSAPQSNTFAGLLTFMSISNITISGSQSTFALAKLASENTVSISKAINYPNPAGTSYFHPRKETGGILTTLAFNFTRPPEAMSVTIYNLAGDRVRQIEQDQISFKFAPSADYKWVYEYDWNGKNDSNENVAPGIYLYRIKADTETRVGKMAIIR